MSVGRSYLTEVGRQKRALRGLQTAHGSTKKVGLIVLLVIQAAVTNFNGGLDARENGVVFTTASAAVMLALPVAFYAI